jgi:anti-sigma B factor antagonist
MSHIEKKNGAITIKPGVDIVVSQCQSLREELLEQINNGEKKIIIDLDGTEMIDSSGIGILISARNSLMKAGGEEIQIINCSSDILHLLKIMRLDKHFSIRT